MSVSTEVQRTLVKSPPELWAELSDPAALARHLADFGEVRITHAEPEQAVDWEATDAEGTTATGRVEISPSGWGTKVTFSATRAVTLPSPPATAAEAATPAEPPAHAAAADEPPSTADPLDSIAAEIDAEDDPPATPDPFASSTSTADADPFASSTSTADADPFASSTSTADADSFASSDTAVNPYLETHPDPPDADPPLAEGDRFEDAPLTEDDAFADDELFDDESVVEDEDELFDDEALGEDIDDGDGVLAEHASAPVQEQPRRGFFARLFGFRRRESAPAEASEGAPPAEPARERRAPIASALPPPELPSAVAIAELATESYEAAGVTPPGAGELLGPEALPPLDPAVAEPASAPEPPEHAQPEHAQPEDRQRELEQPERAQPEQARQPAGAVQPDAPQTGEAVSAGVSANAGQQLEQPLAAGASEAELESAADAQDIARELQAAEEVAAEQVTAVLTSALDHLGAAHHRPFSRG